MKTHYLRLVYKIRRIATALSAMVNVINAQIIMCKAEGSATKQFKIVCRTNNSDARDALQISM